MSGKTIEIGDLFTTGDQGKTYTTYSTDTVDSPVRLVALLAARRGQSEPRVTGDLHTALCDNSLRILAWHAGNKELAVSLPADGTIVQIASLGQQILALDETGNVQPPLSEIDRGNIDDMVGKVAAEECIKHVDDAGMPSWHINYLP